MTLHIRTIRTPQTPRSLNRKGAGWQTWHREKKRWQAQLEILLMAERLPRGVAYVEARANMRFPVARRRDEGNYRALLEKALGDALVNGGWLADDTPEQYRFGVVEFDPQRGPNMTTVFLAFRAE